MADILLQRLLKSLLHYIPRSDTGRSPVPYIGELCHTIFDSDAAAFVWISPPSPPWGWDSENNGAPALVSFLEQYAASLAPPPEGILFQNDPRLGAGENYALLFPVQSDARKNGLLLVRRLEKWTGEQIGLLRVLAGSLGSAAPVSCQPQCEKRQDDVFRTIVDQLATNIYITEPDTDRILFMNQTMRDTFHIEQPVGKICWEILQKKQCGRCSFCPIQFLRSNGGLPVYQWEEHNTLNGRIYQNYDRLIPWLDGTAVHLQQSIDITDLKSACTDELSQMMTRRAGRAALRKDLANIQSSHEALTVCLYDINLLKEVNDLYGHAEGDRLIGTIAAATRQMLDGRDYAFRLSGDEFVLVLFSSISQARQRMNRLTQTLRKLQTPEALYEYSFCYGLAEITPEQPLELDEVLALADERMYAQKRQFHISRSQQRRFAATEPPLDASAFFYDKNRLYDALVQSTDDYLYICNMKTGAFRYPRAMVDEFGLPGEVLQNAAAFWSERIHPLDRPAFLEANQIITDGRITSHCVEYRALNRRGEWIWLRCRGHLELDEHGDPSLFAGFIANLGKKNQIDHMTGLYNKQEFEEQVRCQIEQAPGHDFGIMILGIDDLRHINDLYDRAFGDEVIRVTGQKLQGLLPHDAVLYRMDGDEFALIVREADAGQLRSIYRRIYHSFSAQQVYDGKKYYCSLSAGCVFYPADAGNYRDLIKFAGYSLEHAKKHGKKRCSFFSPEILQERTRALELTEALRESVENGFEGFSVRYQPIIDAGSRQVIGAEALARWESNRFGAVSPVEFIPLLEQSGLIHPVGKWVLLEALHFCRKWERNLWVSVNLSYLQLEADGFSAFLNDTLRREGVSPQSLILELTESDFARETEVVQKAFADIRAMGVRVAMDDFGMGYSSLGILKEAPADFVKIDRTFIQGIRTSTFDATFIRFIVALCHDVGITVCIEGVETEEIYHVLAEMKLDCMQGFLFGYPMKSSEFQRLLSGQPMP